MNHFLSLPAVFCAITAFPAFSDTMGPVKSVDVKAELSAVTNTTAAAFWATLDTDLETAIATRLADRIAETGADISVDIEEVSLSNGFTDRLGVADTRLVGDIAVKDDNDLTRSQFYTLTIDVNAATPMMPEGADPADAEVFYDAMGQAFADSLVRNLR